MKSSRRALLGATAALSTLHWSGAQASEPVRALLARGGVVIALRHALAPGTFDPEGFRLDDCSTQRNLDDEGRRQAVRIGQWFREQRLEPARVRTSPWCRCIDTANLAFGRADRWDALSSPRASDEAANSRRLGEMRQAIAAVPTGRFEAWVSHQFVLQALTGEPTQSAEGLVLRASGDRVQVLARALLY